MKVAIILDLDEAAGQGWLDPLYDGPPDDPAPRFRDTVADHLDAMVLGEIRSLWRPERGDPPIIRELRLEFDGQTIGGPA